MSSNVQIYQTLCIIQNICFILVDATMKPTFKMVQKRFRDLVKEIDTKNFQGDLVEFGILTPEFFHSLRKLSRRERAEFLLIKLFMSPNNWIPIFIKTLQQKYRKSYLSIVNFNSDGQGVSNGKRHYYDVCCLNVVKFCIQTSCSLGQDSKGYISL